MSEFRELSRLPDDPGYWDELEARIVAAAALSPSVAPTPIVWWSPFAARAWQLGAVAAAAAVAALLLLPPRPEASAPLTLVPLPNDPLFDAFLSTASPPPVGTLVVDPQPDGAR